MPIRITCQHCGKQFSAWDDLVGKSVQCPKCQQGMVVPAESPGSAESNRPAQRRRPSQSGPKPPGEKRVKPRATQTRPNPTSSALRTEHPIASRPTRSADTADADRSTDGFDDSDALPIVCPNCRRPMPAHEDLCDRCGFHKILGKVIDLDGVNRRDSSTGFERAVEKHLHPTETAAGTLLWFKVLAGFLLLVILVACLGRWFWIGAFLQSTDGSEINPDPASAALWASALMTQRLVRWRGLEWPFRPVEALVIRDSDFGDEDLAELELADLGALDLEGTKVSNAGLSYLTDLGDLKFLVLRKTDVTIEGVQRVQRTLRDTWIWS